MQIIVRSDEEMQQLGRLLAVVLETGDVVYLVGELGAGKTTLVRGIARGFDYSGRVTSPTFTLMNIYHGKSTIYHFDFYRLEKGDIGDLGLEDYLEKDGIALIEWPRTDSNALPAEYLLVDIRLVEEDYDRERQVTITARGLRYAEKTEELNKIVNSGSR